MTVLLIVVILGAVFAGARNSTSARTWIGKVAREIRVRTGGYTLAMLMQTMLDEMRGSVIRGIDKSYVPGEMHFGLHPHDARRWSDLFPQMSDELADLMSQEIVDRADVLLGGDGLRVILCADPGSEPGRPTFEARMLPRSKPVPKASGPKGAPFEVHDGRTVVASLLDSPVLDAAISATVSDGETTVPMSELLGGWRLIFSDKEILMRRGEMIIGRGPEADIFIDHSDVSREHARLALMDDLITLVDLKSSNGTFVNEMPVKMAMLRAGDKIRFGGAVVVVLLPA